MNLQVFFIAFTVSFFGSIPPGSINITVMQMGIRGRTRSAYFLALGATLVEFMYAHLVVRFQMFLNDHVSLTHHFKLITGITLILLGMYALLAKHAPNLAVSTRERGRTGFMKGLVLGLLNPLAVPFWLAITAYLESNGWVCLTGLGQWFYLVGLSAGSMLTLSLVVKLGNKFTKISGSRILVRVLPGLTCIGLGSYNFFQWYARSFF